MSGNLYELESESRSVGGKPRKGAGKNEPRLDGSSVQRLDGVGDKLDVASLVVRDLGDSLSNPSGVTGRGESLNRVLSESIGVEEVLEVLQGEGVVEDED